MCITWVLSGHTPSVDTVREGTIVLITPWRHNDLRTPTTSFCTLYVDGAEDGALLLVETSETTTMLNRARPNNWEMDKNVGQIRFVLSSQALIDKFPKLEFVNTVRQWYTNTRLEILRHVAENSPNFCALVDSDHGAEAASSSSLSSSQSAKSKASGKG